MFLLKLVQRDILAMIRNKQSIPVPLKTANPFWVHAPKGVDIACYDWKCSLPDAPCLIWGHANGFNSGCYIPFLDLLSTRFKVFAFDARGHGASDKPMGNLEKSYAMNSFAEDLLTVCLAIRDRIGKFKPIHYAAHSLGGIAAILLEGRFGEAPFNTLTLFEPPIYPPKDHLAYENASEAAPLFTKWAARRREWFPNRDALLEEVTKIGTFSQFSKTMLDAYVTSVAHSDITSGLRIYCPGAVESSIYANCEPSGVYEVAKNVSTPTWIFSSDPKVVDSGHKWTPPTIRDVAANMENATYKVLPGGRHLMVQEQPNVCAHEIFSHVFGDTGEVVGM